MLILYLGCVFVNITSSLGQIFLKKTSLKKKKLLSYLTDGNFLLGNFLFVVTVAFSYFILKKMDFSLFYSFTALSYIFIAFLAWLMLGEKIDKFKYLATLFIVIGIIIYNL